MKRVGASLAKEDLSASRLESLVAPGPPPRKEGGDLPVNLLNTHALSIQTFEATAEG